MSARIRQVEHIEGNFSTSVYIELSPENSVAIDSYSDKAQELLRQFTEQPAIKHTAYHLSLSRNVFLKPHLIEQFMSAMDRVLSRLNESVLYLKPEFRIYFNDSWNTAFVAIPVDLDISANAMALLHSVDSVFQRFDLPQFYTNPSPHVSLASACSDIGFKRLEESSIKVKEIQVDDDSLEQLRVDTSCVTVSVGQRIHRIHLKS